MFYKSARILYSACTIIFLTCFAIGQSAKSDKPAFFDIADFNKKSETVEWLVEYDDVAWKTTDVVMALPKEQLAGLGQEWFCFQSKTKQWHAVYGKLNNEKYEVAFHYEIDSAEKIKLSTDKIDQDFLNRHASALKTAKSKLADAIPDGSPRFNQYIRQNADKTFSVWLFPAFQTNRMAVFGGEGVYTIDSTGTKILKNDSYFQKNFRGFATEPPREIWLNYRETEKPTIGAVFFVWYYKSYFTKIFIETAKSNSTVVKSDSGYIWINVEKDPSANTAEKDDPSRPKLERKKPDE